MPRLGTSLASMRGNTLSALAALLMALQQPHQGSTVAVTGLPAPPSDAWPEADPIAIVTEYNPWAMVIGADSPRVLLFADGTLIRTDLGGHALVFSTARLTPSEVSRVQTAIGSMTTFMRLRNAYNLTPSMSDMPTVEIVRNEGRLSKTVEVYGYRSGFVDVPATCVSPTGEKADRLPSEFDQAYRVLVGLRPTRLARWYPRYLEVMVWPFEHSRKEPLAWPDTWPDLTHPLTIQRGDSYSLILPSTEQSTLESFLAARFSGQAVRIGGRKWSISWRPVTPGGPVAREVRRRVLAVPRPERAKAAAKGA